RKKSIAGDAVGVRGFNAAQHGQQCRQRWSYHRDTPQVPSIHAISRAEEARRSVRTITIGVAIRPRALFPQPPQRDRAKKDPGREEREKGEPSRCGGCPAGGIEGDARTPAAER